MTSAASARDLELREGKVRVKGAPGLEKTIAEIAMHAHFFRLSMPDDPTLTSGMDAAYTYDHPLRCLRTTAPTSALTANYADYLMPTVHELPENIRVGHVETPKAAAKVAA